MDDKLLDILTDHQRSAYLLKCEGYTDVKIAEALSVSPQTAKRWYKNARHVLAECRLYHLPRLGNDTPISLSLTRGELLLLTEALIAYSNDMIREVGGSRRNADWQSSLPYSARILEGFFARAYVLYYHEPANYTLFDF